MIGLSPGKDALSSGIVGGLSGLNLNVANKFQPPPVKENGNCERYYDKISADEWVPDTLVPLAFDRASEAKVGVFFVRLGEQVSKLRGNVTKNAEPCRSAQLGTKIT